MNRLCDLGPTGLCSSVLPPFHQVGTLPSQKHPSTMLVPVLGHLFHYILLCIISRLHALQSGKAKVYGSGF